MTRPPSRPPRARAAAARARCARRGSPTACLERALDGPRARGARRCALPDGSRARRLRRRAPRRRADDPPPTHLFRRLATPRRARVRRGVHGRRVAHRRPARPARPPAPQRRRRRRAPQRLVGECSRPVPVPTGARALARSPPDRLPLRPRQRALRAVPRPDDDLLVRPLRAPERAARGRAAPQDGASASSSTCSPATSVLEIGCGWGSFAITAAREYGVRVTGLTLSHEQAELARARVAAAGLADRIDIVETDYRDAPRAVRRRSRRSR